MALALTKWFVSVFKVYVGVFAHINKYSMMMVIYPSRTQDYYGCFVIYILSICILTSFNVLYLKLCVGFVKT